MYRSGNPTPPPASSLTHPGTWGGTLWEAQKSPGVHMSLIQLLVPSETQFINKIFLFFFNDHCDFYVKNKGECENQCLTEEEKQARCSSDLCPVGKSSKPDLDVRLPLDSAFSAMLSGPHPDQLPGPSRCPLGGPDGGALGWLRAQTAPLGMQGRVPQD